MNVDVSNGVPAGRRRCARSGRMTTAAEKAIETEKTTAPDKRKALGRGLESLLPGGPRVVAGKETIPAIVRKVSDQQAAEMTIVENLQRQDLNCLEQAYAFAQLSQVFHLTQDQIGQRTGSSRESISNYMRLLKLPASVQQFLREGRLGFSEARVLLTLLDPKLIPKIADEAVRKHLSVEQLEDLVFDTNVPLQKQDQPGRGARWVDPNVRAAQTELERVLGGRVRIRDRKGKGKIVIEHATLEDVERVVEMLTGKQW